VVPALVIVSLVFAGLQFVRQASEPTGPAHYEQITLKVGSVLPDIFLQPLEQQAILISSLNKKVILINFWASWCPPCLIELPSLVRLRDAYHERGFEVIAINVDDNPEKMIPRFKAEKKLTFPLFYDIDQKISALLEVQALPLTVIIDQQRRILYFETGERDWNSREIRSRLEAWLAG